MMWNRYRLWLTVMILTSCVPAAWAVTLQALPVTESSTPFFAAQLDLTADGYVEDEYLVSGSANVYEYTEELTLQVRTADVPYTSRIMVRRPAAVDEFNGVVVFEMMNPTAGFDIDFMWHFLRPELVEQGYIWVGLTVRDNAAGVLKFWNPERYAAIDIPDRGVSYELYGELAALFRDQSNPVNPLADYAVTQVLGTGYSQSDDWLTTFSNEFHSAALDASGVPAFDGYLTAGGNAAARTLNGTDTEFYTDERRYNHVEVPYFRIQTESELEIFSFPANNTRQPDSNVFRQWEVAGTAHADAVSRGLVGAVLQRDFGAPFPPCDEPISQVTAGPYMRAALYHLKRWVQNGTLPPASLAIELNGPNDVRRDAFGNALGGIRSPELEAPVATYIPYNSGPGPCIFSGTVWPFDSQQIGQLYQNHGQYVKRTVKAVNALQAAGYLLENDAEAFKQAAADSGVGK